MTGCVSREMATIVIVPGVYSNIQESQETGDLSGVEISLTKGAESKFADITFCEGWCNYVARVPLRKEGGRIAFDYPDRAITSDGVHLTDYWKMTAEPAGQTLVLHVRFPTQSERFVLTKIEGEFGLAVARGSQ